MEFTQVIPDLEQVENSREEARKRVAMLKVWYEDSPRLSPEMFEVYQGFNRIGRSSEDNEIVLKSDQVSGKHAVLSVNASHKTFVLTDLGSSNHSFLGEAKPKKKDAVLPNVPNVLQSGDWFWIANVKCWIEDSIQSGRGYANFDPTQTQDRWEPDTNPNTKFYSTDNSMTQDPPSGTKERSHAKASNDAERGFVSAPEETNIQDRSTEDDNIATQTVDMEAEEFNDEDEPLAPTQVDTQLDDDEEESEDDVETVGSDDEAKARSPIEDSDHANAVIKTEDSNVKQSENETIDGGRKGDNIFTAESQERIQEREDSERKTPRSSKNRSKDDLQSDVDMKKAGEDADSLKVGTSVSHVGSIASKEPMGGMPFVSKRGKPSGTDSPVPPTIAGNESSTRQGSINTELHPSNENGKAISTVKFIREYERQDGNVRIDGPNNAHATRSIDVDQNQTDAQGLTVEERESKPIDHDQEVRANQGDDFDHDADVDDNQAVNANVSDQKHQPQSEENSGDVENNEQETQDEGDEEKFEAYPRKSRKRPRRADDSTSASEREAKAMTVAQLRLELSKLGENTDGRKAELVTRLKSAREKLSCENAVREDENSDIAKHRRKSREVVNTPQNDASKRRKQSESDMDIGRITRNSSRQSKHATSSPSTLSKEVGVMFTGIVPDKSAADRIGATIIENEFDRVTHLVVNEDEFKRTIKFYRIMSLGGEHSPRIVNEKWLRSSAKAGKVLDANDFIPVYKKPRLDMAEALRRRDEGSLLLENKVLIKLKGVKLPEEVWKVVVENLGGKVAKTLPRDITEETGGNYIVVGSDESVLNSSTVVKRVQKLGGFARNFEWFSSGVSKFQFDW